VRKEKDDFLAAQGFAAVNCLIRGINRVAIECDGSVYPCSVFPMTIGNLRFESLNRILSESKRLKDYLKFRVRNLPENCQTCESFHFCSFCPGLSYIEHGDYKSKCEFNCMRTKLNAIANKKSDKSTSHI
jgi:radical SAM protein with 4Fe4S-binding SPASM domain